MKRIQARLTYNLKNQLAIATNPHLKPEAQRELWDRLDELLPQKERMQSEEFDEDAFNRMAEAMRQGSGFVVK